MVNCTNTVLDSHHFVHFLFIGQTKSACSLCGKLYICVDKKNKLTSSSLKFHLLKAHSSNPQVRAAYLLDEVEKELNPTPRQTIMRFAKSMSKQEAQLDVYPRGSYQDVDINRALTHWLSGGFMNFCLKMNPINVA